jgi:ATP-dependent Lhr-like helicase
VAEVSSQVWPDVRDPDELHDVLLDLGVLPARDGAAWEPFLEALVRDGRAARARRRGGEAWVAAERVGLVTALDRDLRLDPPLAPLASERVPDSAEEAATAALRGWMARLGPTTAALLADRLSLPASLVRDALLQLELQGLVLRGRFLADAPHAADAPHWCERHVLARIHRLTLGRLRREIEPVGVADLIRFLTRWQHALAGQRLHGRRGVAEVVAQLQGFHAPAGAWEREILPARVAAYDPHALDELCLQGEVAWGRLAAASGGDEAPRRRNAPTRNAPVALATRRDLGWLAAAGGGAAPLGPSAQALVDVLARVGASFLPDLAAMTGRLPGEIEGALWELVSAGAVTCDAFAGLRALVDAERPRHGRRPGLAGGRWALLARPAVAADELLRRTAEQYLQRWGVVFRDLLAREPTAPAWRELLGVYRRSEARGEIRGGRFVTGFSGEQFATAGAVEALRAVRRAPRQGHERVDLSAADPLNLVGLVTPGARVAATLGNRVAYVDGVPAPPRAVRAV